MKLFKKIFACAIASSLIVGLTGCGNSTSTEKKTDDKKVEEKKMDDKKELTGTLDLFAAASLKISLEKIIKEFNKEHPKVEIKLVTNGSDKLFNQMKEGAPCDIFISASEKWMKEAVSNDLVSSEEAKPLLNNEVVLIKNINAPDIKLSDIKDGKDLCLGAESVPVGGYSKKYFESIGVWDALKEDTSFEPQVTDVVKKVAEGARNYGLVYKTDANSEIKNKTIAVCDKIPEDSGIKVIYPIGITKKVNNKKIAETFSKYLREGVAKDILEDIGFVFVK